MTAYGYTRVPGSDRLRTQPVGGGPAAELEALDPAVPTGRLVEGEWLARCVVRDRYLPVLLEVYDRLALGQEAYEQAVYGHLYRLALAEERNWCRVALKELQQRTRLSERRVNKALAGLVEKGHVKLVERDRRGTLYRVMLPHEVFGEPDGDTIHMPRPKADKAGKSAPAGAGKSAQPGGQAQPGKRAERVEPPKPVKPAQRSEPAKEARPREPARAAKKAAFTASPSVGEPLLPARAAGAAKARSAGAAQPTPRDSDTLLDSSSMGALALSFVARFGERPGRTREDLVEEILGRLEEGVTLPEVAVELAAFGAGAPRATPVSELARFVERTRS